MTIHFNRRAHNVYGQSVSKEPLSERRFQELLGQASALFASQERDPAQEKARVVAEIQALMKEWGIAVEDLWG
jgi:hypothetical protein